MKEKCWLPVFSLFPISVSNVVIVRVVSFKAETGETQVMGRAISKFVL